MVAVALLVTATALIKMTLLSHRSTSAVRTTVETDNAVVTLSGSAKKRG